MENLSQAPLEYICGGLPTRHPAQFPHDVVLITNKAKFRLLCPVMLGEAQKNTAKSHLR
jgi:hypothetical protein